MKTAQAVKEGVIQRYQERTPGSYALDQRSRRVLPGGDTRWSTYYQPYPIYTMQGAGCVLTDVDGNQYRDFQNNYTVLVHGHAHPDITRALQEQTPRGVIHGAPTEDQYILAELLAGRFPGIQQLRFTNSGTEATMMAMRTARAFTGKPIILKMDGGYHGSHDYAEVNTTPDISDSPLPRATLAYGVPAEILNTMLVARFNDLDSVESLLKAHHNQIAAIIVEPMMNAAGIIVAETDFLPGLRALADRYDVLLIFDEVVTFRLHEGGYQSKTGVLPDLTALGKSIGGGLPIGAFGGRADIMRRFDPAENDGFHHSGTFNGNAITMATGIACVRALTAEAIAHINSLGDEMRIGIDEAFAEAGIHGRATGEGSLLYVHWTPIPIESAADVIRWKQRAAELPRLLHLQLLNLGVFTANRGLINLSTPMSRSDVTTTLTAFRETLFTLKPYVQEMAPHLII
jgi:glutamate-1-semialdehyde 2,1-aminomutase